MTAPPQVSGLVDDAALIEESLHDPERFAGLYDRHFSDIHRYLAGRVGRELANDLAAETFLTAFRRRETFDPVRGRVRPWLFGIATRKVADHRRTEGRRLRAFARVTAEVVVDGPEDGVAARVTAQRARPQLARGLRGLSRGDRDVMFLAALGGLSYEEIAIALDIPGGTVGSRLSRARRRLRQELGETNPMKEN